MNILKKVLFFLLVVFLAAQFFGPEKNQGDVSSLHPFLAETSPSEDVHVILKEACFDCHSDYTRYPWYSSITPVNFWLADHIDHGKDELNFSRWNEYSIKRKDHKLEEIIEMVEERSMPLESYTWTHKEAKLTPEQIEQLTAWVNQART